MPTDTIEPPAAPHNQYAETDAKIDALFDSGPSEEQESKPAPAPEPKPPAPTPSATPPPKEPVQSQDDHFADDIPKRHKPTPKPSEPATTQPAKQDTAQEIRTPKELREAYAKEKAEREKLASEIADVRKQVEAAKKAGETEAESRYRAELEQLRKEREELDTKVRYTDYTRSDEYKTKYLEPLENTWLAIGKELDGVTITNADGESSKVTNDHMMQLVRMPTVQAAKQASEWFGAAASEMMGYRRKLLDLYQSRDAAVEEWRTKGSELAARQQKESEEATRTIVGLFDSEVEGMRKNMPELFAADDKDADEKRYFEKGSAIVNIAFKGLGLKDGMTFQQKREAVARAQANVATKAAAFGVVVHRLNQKDKEIDELKSKLASYEKTEPGSGDQGRGGQPTKSTARTPEDELDAMTFEP